MPLGDAAAYVEFSGRLEPEVNDAVQRLAVAVRGAALPWIVDVVPGLGGLALHFDPDQREFPLSALAEVQTLVDTCIKAGLPPAEDLGRLVDVPVCYEPEYALDAEEVARHTGLSFEEVARRHAAAEYRVLMIGFAPGHGYLGFLDPALAVPRRAVPRTEVPGGSVAIANEQTVVYPYAIAGGWSIIGRTPLALFDPERARPSLFAPGDRVRFRAISKVQFLQWSSP